jgi:AraC-like DNA-binding protein
VEQAGWQHLILPGVYAQTWLAYAAEQGWPVPDLVRQAGLATEAAASFSAGVPVLKLVQLMLAVSERAEERAVGIEIGWRMPPTTFGSLGNAMLASATARDALDLCLRYWRLLARGLSLQVSRQDDRCVLTFSQLLPAQGRLRSLMVESTLASVYRGLLALMPGAAAHLEVWFDTPEPPYAAQVRERMPGVRFGMPLLQCRLPDALLDTPLPMASVVGRQAALQQCEREAQLLNLPETLGLRVQKELGIDAAGFPGLEQIAERLGMTARTLRRRLQEEGTSYSRLLDEARCRDAVRLLDNPALEVAQVAELLGYNDSANFTRAFRKWTGMTPSQCRLRSAKAESGPT